MDVTTEFSLSALTDITIELTEGDLSVSEITGRVLHSISDEHLRAALSITLTDYVRGRLGHQRRAATKPLVPQNHSMRVVRQQQSNWNRLCSAQIHIGVGRYRIFGDCTADDLAFAARERFDQAEANRREARRYAEASAILRTSQAATIRTMPVQAREVVESIFTP